MQEPAQTAETGLAEAKSDRPDGGKARISKCPNPGFRHLEAGLLDEVAQGLDVPGVKVMIGFGGIEMLAYSPALQRDIQRQPASGFEQPPDFFQNIRRTQDVFQRVMANHHVRNRVRQNPGVGDKFNAQGAKGRLQKIRDVMADFPPAAQSGQIPPGPGAVFQNHVAGLNQRCELARPERGHPRDGLRREAAFGFVVTAPRVAAVMALGLLGRHERQCRAARRIAQGTGLGFNETVDVKVKICGITRAADAEAAVEAGADAVGLMFYPGSPRYLPLEKAREIARLLPPFVIRTGVFADPDPSDVFAAIQHCELNLLQFHGAETPEFCLQFGLMTMKAFRVQNADSLPPMSAYRTDAFLLDSHVAGKPGGTGETFNWDLALEAKKFGKLIFLAGGLTPQNVAEAVRKAQPFGVDVSSGVEQSPGKKDARKMRDFIAAARGA